MKLNLLPTTVSKGAQAKSATLFSILIAVAGLILGGYLNVSSTKALDQAKSDQQASTGPALEAYTKSTEADTIMNDVKSVALIRDASLATDMIKHNDVYPDLYEGLKPYIPSFFRINSLSASAGGATSATITLVGTIDTYEQYANLMLAFSRYPGLVSISRAGFVSRDEIVPNINATDTEGKPRRPDQAPIPDDKLERLAYFQASVQPDGYTGEGNFGTGTDSTREAMPTASLVTVTLTVTKNLQTPDPRQTIVSGSSGGGAAAAPAGGMGGPPQGMGGPPGATAGGGAPPAAATKKGKKAADDSD